MALLFLIAPLYAQQWYKGELHCHSLWSDGNTLPELVYDWYRTNGFHFVSLTDHNILQLDTDRWQVVDTAIIAESRRKFGDAFVETRLVDDKTQMRLKNIHELSGFFNEDGRFLVIPGHEQNTTVVGRTLHANAINISESIPYPSNFPTVVEAALAWRKASLENSAKDGNIGFWMLNHPEWPYFEVSPENLIKACEIEFYEWNVCSPALQFPIHPDHPTHERYWDIVNSFRLIQGKPLIYLVATSDAHEYRTFGNYLDNPGRGWVGVRAEKLEANALFTAMKKGDFYSSTGVEMEEIRFDANTGTLYVEVKPEEGIFYSIRFVGTKKNFDTSTRPFDDPQVGRRPARTGLIYSGDIGITFQTTSGTSASYQMSPDDLYVRAVISSSKRPEYRESNEPLTMTALTQPYSRIQNAKKKSLLP